MWWWVSRAVLIALKEAHSGEVVRLQAAMVGLTKELAIEKQKVLGLEKALAVSQSNVDWMRHYANALSEDRRSLAGLKGIELPAPRFEGQLQTPADVEARALAAAKQREAGGGAPVEVGRAIEDATDLDAAMAAYTGHVNGFEDLGDEEAERQGIRHNETDGSVEYAKK
jgi:hypothetical protein